MSYPKAFTTQTVFSASGTPDDFRTITVVANGGSVTVELKHSSGPDVWVLAETFTADGAYVFRPGSFDFRVTPVGGAAEFNLSGY